MRFFVVKDVISRFLFGLIIGLNWKVVNCFVNDFVDYSGLVID